MNKIYVYETDMYKYKRREIGKRYEGIIRELRELLLVGAMGHLKMSTELINVTVNFLGDCYFYEHHHNGYFTLNTLYAFTHRVHSMYFSISMSKYARSNYTLYTSLNKLQLCFVLIRNNVYYIN